MNLFELLKEGTLINIVRICDLIKFDFLVNNSTICIHTQSALVRGFIKDEMVFSSTDIFSPSKNFKKKIFRRFKWDVPNSTLFDDQINCYIGDFCKKTIEQIIVKGKDLIIYLTEGYCIEILSNTLKKDSEIFRLFKKGDIGSHIVKEN